MTVGSSVLTQSIKTTTALAQNIVIQSTETNQTETEDMIFEESSLPKDFMTSVVLQRLDNGDNPDDQQMEIDEGK